MKQEVVIDHVFLITKNDRFLFKNGKPDVYIHLPTAIRVATHLAAKVVKLYILAINGELFSKNGEVYYFQTKLEAELAAMIFEKVSNA